MYLMKPRRPDLIAQTDIGDERETEYGRGVCAGRFLYLAFALVFLFPVARVVGVRVSGSINQTVGDEMEPSNGQYEDEAMDMDDSEGEFALVCCAYSSELR